MMYPGKNIKLQISDVMGDCEQDMALYKVFKLENLIDVTEYMEIEKYIPDTSSLDGQISTTLSNVVVIDGATSSSLSSLISSNNLELNPESLTKDLESGLDQLDLTTAAGQLYQVASDSRITDQTLRQQYQKMGDDLTALNNHEVSAMQVSMGALKQELKATSDSLSSIKTTLSEILARAGAIQTTLVDEGTELMTQGATRFRERLVGLAQGYVSHVQKALNNEVGQCQPLHDVYEGSSDVVCDYFAGAVNGIWMSTGIIALSLLALLIFSLSITKYYRPPSDGRKVSRDELACSNSMFDVIRGRPHRNNNSSAQSPSGHNAAVSGTNSDRSWTSENIKPHHDNSTHMDQIRPVMVNQQFTSITHVDEVKPKCAKKCKSVTFVEAEIPTEKDNCGTVSVDDDQKVTLGHKDSNSATYFDLKSFIKQVSYSVMMPEAMIQDVIGVMVSYVMVLAAENTSACIDTHEGAADTITTEGNISDTEDDTALNEPTCEPDADGDSFV